MLSVDDDEDEAFLMIMVYGSSGMEAITMLSNTRLIKKSSCNVLRVLLLHFRTPSD